MKTTTSTAIVALVAATIGFAAFAPAAYAEDQRGRPMMGQDDNGGPRMADLRGPGGFRGGLIDLVCSDKGAERLEIAFVRISHQITLTAEQQTLFDALKTKALTEQTKFADTCQATRPAKTADVKPDFLTGLKASIAIDTARLEALNSVLPEIEAFYSSLTPEQKAALMDHDGRGGGRFGDRGHGGPDAPKANG